VQRQSRAGVPRERLQRGHLLDLAVAACYRDKIHVHVYDPAAASIMCPTSCTLLAVDLVTSAGPIGIDPARGVLTDRTEEIFMATTDYDAPRTAVVEEDSLEELQARRGAPRTGAADVDEADPAEAFELPGAEQLDEELAVPVIPMQSDEFRCSRCFLVRHRNQRVAAGVDVCRECA
jgi:hypothetical protein